MNGLWVPATVVALSALSCSSNPQSEPGATAMVPIAVEAADSGSRLPDVAFRRAPLALRVQYPAPDAVIDARDSSFLFGTAGSGDATLTINGAPVRVWPNGAWLAWVALPADSLMRFDLVARTPRDSATLTFTARRPARFNPPPARSWVDSTSISPRGSVWVRPDEYVPVTVRAVEGARVRIRLPGGDTVDFAPDPRPEDIPWGVRAFERDTLKLRAAPRADRYVALIRGRAIGASPGPVLGPKPRVMAKCCMPPMPDPAGAVIEAIVGTDTARVAWPLRLALLDSLPTVVELDDDTLGRGDTDSLTVGRAAPGATYYWFFPTGTRAAVAARSNGDLRLRLSSGAEAWVPAAEARLLPRGTPSDRVTVGSVSLTALSDRVSLRIPMSQRAPFQVSEDDRSLRLTVFGATGDVNWIRYGGTDSLVRRIAWAQQRLDEVRLDVELARPVWGYRTRWDGRDLILEVRRPPVVEKGDPLRGRRIVVDAGHPPLGASGPTGFREAEANLGVALKLRELLEKDGARVILTRTSDSAVDLLPRVQLAERANAELLISVHNNALPDGVNPFTNNGTSVYYNQPRSIPLAVEVQRGLLRRLGLHDLGVGRGDLALVRTTWMPSILCEGLYMTLPDQEAALRSEEGQRLYAQGVAEGIRRYLRNLAEAD
jgi:N-acetylmuramoyl-L-alanine amidase